jgi:hypothetical protein
MPGRVQRANDDGAELELPAVLERLVVVLGRSKAVDVDRRARCERQPAVARHVVGVVVRLEDVLDLDTHVACEVEVDVDLEARIDDGRDSRLLVADEVGRAAEVVMGDLSEDHRATIQRWAAPEPGAHRASPNESA